MAPRRQQSELNDSKIPSTQLSRVFGFGTLAARLALGTITSGSAKSEQNVEVLASTLCRMRGAALKLGQMLSIQDENIFPKEFTQALEKVREGADRMPLHQLKGVLEEELGEKWSYTEGNDVDEDADDPSVFSYFEEIPVAAASLVYSAKNIHFSVVPPSEAQCRGQDNSERPNENFAFGQATAYLYRPNHHRRSAGGCIGIESDVKHIGTSRPRPTIRQPKRHFRRDRRRNRNV